MNRKIVYNIIAVVSTIGILCWMVTDFFGGMIIYLLDYGLIIFPLILLYIFSFFDTIMSVTRLGVKQNRTKFIFHSFVLVAIILTNIYQSDLLKSKRILTATLKDDLFNYTLIFRENGNCENEVSGIFGYQKVYHGKYTLKGDTIFFEKKPYNNDFLPDTLLIDRNAKAIFIKKDKKGSFDTTKDWLNHFEIK